MNEQRQGLFIAKRNSVSCRHGFSLLELMIVMMILVATAVIVLPMFRTTVATAERDNVTANEITTMSTMKALQEAIAGDEGVLENLAHEPDALPREVSDLVESEAPQHVKSRNPQLAKFNELYGIGWRGPYLQATGKNKNGLPTIIDGWGTEIELQVDFDDNGEVDSKESRFIRLVSAGPNGQIDTPSDTANMEPGADDSRSLTLSDCGDDLVVFLCVPDDRQ